MGASPKNEPYHLPRGGSLYPPAPALVLFASYKQPRLIRTQPQVLPAARHAGGVWAVVGSLRQSFFQLAHDRLRANAQPPGRAAHTAPNQGYRRSFSPYPRDFLTVLQLKRASTGRTVIPLGAVRRSAVAINRIGLLKNGVGYRNKNHGQRHMPLHVQHTTCRSTFFGSSSFCRWVCHLFLPYSSLYL